MSPPTSFPFAALLLLLSLLFSTTPSSLSSHGDSCPALSDGSTDRHSCPVKCLLTNPVCGEDGVTYWCGCAEAACSGVRVAKRGACQLGNGGSVAANVAGQAFLLIHIVFLIGVGFACLFDVL